MRHAVDIVASMQRNGREEATIRMFEKLFIYVVRNLLYLSYRLRRLLRCLWSVRIVGLWISISLNAYVISSFQYICLFGAVSARMARVDGTNRSRQIHAFNTSTRMIHRINAFPTGYQITQWNGDEKRANCEKETSHTVHTASKNAWYIDNVIIKI